MNPKKFFFSILLVSICFLTGPVLAQDEGKMAIAILELDPREVDAVAAATITDFLRTYLIQTEVFDVLERAKMSEILKEQKFQLTGCTTSECAVQAGRLLNVHKIIVGSLSLLGKTYYTNARLVDVETGKVDFATEVSCACPIDILPTSMKDLANKIARKFQAEGSVGKVKAVRDLDVSAGTGMIFLKSSPERARVFLDGELKGTAPISMVTVDAGEHYIRAEWEDGRKWEKMVTVKPEDVIKLEAVAEAFKGTKKLTILSDPPEAVVFVDGERKGKTPLILKELKKDKYVIKLKKNNLIYTGDVYFEDNKNITINPKLLPFPKLNITSDPSGAEVYVNKKLIGKTPLSKEIEMETMTKEIEFFLKKGNKISTKEKITLNVGETYDLNFILKDYPEVNISSNPSGAEVYINGNLIGNTPLQKLIKTVGDIDVFLKKDNLFYAGEDNLHAGEKYELNYTLLPCPELRIISNPSGAEVYISGNLIGNTPLQKLIKTVGDIDVFLKKDTLCYGGKENLQAGESYDFEFNLLCYPILDISSIPNSADVYIDNKLVGKTPFKEAIGAAGKVNIFLKKDDRIFLEERTIQAGEKYALRYTLIPYPELRITSDPINAEAYINKKLIGKTPITVNYEITGYEKVFDFFLWKEEKSFFSIKRCFYREDKVNLAPGAVYNFDFELNEFPNYKELLKWKYALSKRIPEIFSISFRKYCRKNNLKISRKEWVASISPSYWEEFKNSGLDLDEWLEKELTK